MRNHHFDVMEWESSSMVAGASMSPFVDELRESEQDGVKDDDDEIE